VKTKSLLRLFCVFLCSIPFAAFAETHEEYLRRNLILKTDASLFARSFEPMYSALALAAAPAAWIGNFIGSANDESVYHFYIGFQVAGTLGAAGRSANSDSWTNFGASALPFIRIGGLLLPFDFALGGMPLQLVAGDTQYNATELFFDFRYRVIQEETGFDLADTSDRLPQVLAETNAIPSVAIHGGLGYMTIEHRIFTPKVAMSTAGAEVYPNVLGDADIAVTREYRSLFFGLQASKRIVIWNKWLEENAMLMLNAPVFAIEPYIGIQCIWATSKTDGEAFADNMQSTISGVPTALPSLRIVETYDYSPTFQSQVYGGLALAFAGFVQINLGASYNFINSILGAMVSLGYRR
jgi:hypothetical protein